MSPLENQLLNIMNQLGGCTNAEDITQVDRLKVALCGAPGTWKSYTIAHTARKPLMHYDFDDRRESIAGAKDTVIKTLIDKTDQDYVAWASLENDVSVLEYLKEKNEMPFKSIALDSFTFLRQYAEHQFMKDAGDVKKATFNIGTTKYVIPRGWDAVVGVQKMLQGILRRLFALNVDVYAVFHTRPEKDQNKSTAEKTIYKDSLTIEPDNLKMLLPMFNEKWRMKFDDKGYKVQMKCDWEFTANTALHNIGEELQEPDIQKLLEKHNKNGK